MTRPAATRSGTEAFRDRHVAGGAERAIPFARSALAGMGRTAHGDENLELARVLPATAEVVRALAGA